MDAVQVAADAAMLVINEYRPVGDDAACVAALTKARAAGLPNDASVNEMARGLYGFMSGRSDVLDPLAALSVGEETLALSVAFHVLDSGDDLAVACERAAAGSRSVGPSLMAAVAGFMGMGAMFHLARGDVEAGGALLLASAEVNGVGRADAVKAVADVVSLLREFDRDVRLRVAYSCPDHAKAFRDVWA